VGSWFRSERDHMLRKDAGLPAKPTGAVA
jgi:hypothetical protein